MLDNKNNWYLIPNKLKDQFIVAATKAKNTGDFKELEEEFGHFKTGGGINLRQLYVKESNTYNRREYKE